MVSYSVDLLHLFHFANQYFQGTRIGRVRIIFTLPKQVETHLGTQPAPRNWPTEPLAYIEWYSKLEGAADPKPGLMYHIKKVTTTSNPVSAGCYSSSVTHPPKLYVIPNISKSCAF